MTVKMNSETNLAARRYKNVTDLGLTQASPGIVQLSHVQTAKKPCTVVLIGVADDDVTVTLQKDATSTLNFAGPGAVPVVFAAGIPNVGILQVHPGSQDGNIIVNGEPYWGIKVDDAGTPVNWSVMIVLELGQLMVESGSAGNGPYGGDNYHVVSAAWNAIGKLEDSRLNPALFD